MDLYACQDFAAENEELVAFLFTKGIYHQALPQYINLLILKRLAIRLLRHKLQEVKSLVHLLYEVQTKRVICDQRIQELSILTLPGVCHVLLLVAEGILFIG